ncbi:MAG: hypothetical protein ABIH79_02655 [archaeon]
MVILKDKARKPNPEVIVVDGSERNVSRRMTLILSMGSFALSLIFLVTNITGNAISNFSTNDTNLLGVIFFILAIIGFWIYIRGR